MVISSVFRLIFVVSGLGALSGNKPTLCASEKHLYLYLYLLCVWRYAIMNLLAGGYGRWDNDSC